MTSSSSPPSSERRSFRVLGDAPWLGPPGGAAFAPRTPGVVERLALWNGKRPAGAPPLLRVSTETAPPTCYPWLLAGEIADAERRAFHPWRALRRGVDDDGRAYAVQPAVAGVSAEALLARLGAGEAELDVLVHVAHELAEAVLLLGTSHVVIGAGDEGEAVALGRRRTNMMARPVTLAHVVIGFDGDVALDVVTDSWSNARGVPWGDRERRLSAASFDEQMAAWVLATNAMVAALLRRLAGNERDLGGLVDVTALDALDVLGARPEIARGRRALVDMVAQLFPEERRRALEALDDAAVT